MDQHIQQREVHTAFEKYGDELFRFCLVRVRNREEAVDLVQDTFTRLLEYLLIEGNEIGHLRGFIYRTARNLIIDQYRKSSSFSLDILVEEGFEPGSERTVDAMIAHTDIRLSAQLFKKLDPASREVLYLRFMQDLSLDDIAEALEISKNVVSVRLNRAQKKLRAIADTYEQ